MSRCICFVSLSKTTQDIKGMCTMRSTKLDTMRKPEMTIREALKTNYQCTRQRGHLIRIANHSDDLNILTSLLTQIQILNQSSHFFFAWWKHDCLALVEIIVAKVNLSLWAQCWKILRYIYITHRLFEVSDYFPFLLLNRGDWAKHVSLFILVLFIKCLNGFNNTNLI